MVTGVVVAGLAALLLVPLLLRASHAGTTSPGGAIVTGDSTQITGLSGSGQSAQPTPGHTLVIKPQDLDHPPPPVQAASAYLLDAGTGDALYAYQPFEHLPMLSTTKLMTAILAMEQRGNNLGQRITITEAMSRDTSQLSPDSALFGIKKGETYTLRDLLYGLLFVSGNDAAIAIADALGGNLQHFVGEMNAKAQQLGMFDTHFMNPHGLLQTGQYSSAHDLALLGRYSMSIAELHTISGEKSYYIPAGGNHPVRYLINENQFLWWYPGVDGGKTGYDGQTDYIQVMSVTRNHHHLIGVVMDTDNWWTDMRDLMNWGFDSFTWVSPRIIDTQHPIPYDYLWNYFAKDTIDVTIPTADKGRYYVYTGEAIDGLIMNYFDAHGGLKTFGYPTSMMKSPGASVVSQQFQKAAIQCNLSKKVCEKG
jgi:D-alanyl-D-alanine carboxypeptidase